MRKRENQACSEFGRLQKFEISLDEKLQQRKSQSNGEAACAECLSLELPTLPHRKSQ